MKSMRLPLVAIFFMTNFYRAGGHGPLGPPGSATDTNLYLMRRDGGITVTQTLTVLRY